MVSRCEPGEAFAFDVSSFGLAVARWSYELTATPTGCTLTETWEDRRGRLIGVGGRLVTGVSDRERFTTQSIDATLAAVKEHAERSEGGSRGAR